jgi:trk system potassium uptake protein TrkA
MGVDEIVHPEEETADRWAKKLNMQGVVDSFELTKDYSIINATVPVRFAGKTLLELNLSGNYNIIVLTTIKIVEEKNLIGITKKVSKIQGVATSQTLLSEGDILVMYGNVHDIERLLKEE